ncbi:MAG: hypothetical protein Hyperionvirus1_111 [Hyperionvirus sp.]|uniref:Uncharacterized protein n=1 Tax=Hyperionvirus sp. TaxID=2487770 RepID=A0A3G5A682_9VIRU|nr:MAG: hypothetical protein Hyperionvirus1_111 [Hyperionvirus sp.]
MGNLRSKPKVLAPTEITPIEISKYDLLPTIIRHRFEKLVLTDSEAAESTLFVDAYTIFKSTSLVKECRGRSPEVFYPESRELKGKLFDIETTLLEPASLKIFDTLRQKKMLVVFYTENIFFWKDYNALLEESGYIAPEICMLDDIEEIVNIRRGQIFLVEDYYRPKHECINPVVFDPKRMTLILHKSTTGKA